MAEQLETAPLTASQATARHSDKRTPYLKSALAPVVALPVDPMKSSAATAGGGFPPPLGTYAIEYLSSAHRGIVMHVESYDAKTVSEVIAHAKIGLPEVLSKYAARGYRVRDVDGVCHASGEAES